MLEKSPQSPAPVLTIGGSDNSCGAGVQMDLKTITALGGHAMTVVTSLTSQSHEKVFSVTELPSEKIREQIQCSLLDFHPEAVKIGMLGNLDILKVVLQELKRLKLPNVVLDPVLVSSSGKSLLSVSPDKSNRQPGKPKSNDKKDHNDFTQSKVFSNFIDLFSLTTLITPNIPEAEAFTQTKIHSKKDIEKAATWFLDHGAQAVLVKGGHSNDKQLSEDYLLCHTNKLKLNKWISALREPTLTSPHGTGCLFSSAIATCLAKGLDVEKSIQLSKKYITLAIRNSYFTNNKIPVLRPGLLNNIDQEIGKS